MQLKDFFDYKNRLMEDILTNDKIVPLLKDGVTTKNSSQLAYKQVFPCEYVPETVQDGQTFICFDVDIQNVVNKTYYNIVLYIWVFTHRSNIRSPHGGIRTDEICSEICNAINGSRLYGLGALDRYAWKRCAPMTDYQGKVMTFTASEFNRQHDGKKPIPTNRKNP